MKETKTDRRLNRRVCGVHDIKMLDNLENAKKFKSPAQTVLVRGIHVKIKDIAKDKTVRL